MDNSIQATVDNAPGAGRRVKVHVALGKTAGESYVIVYDNGRGMDVDGIKAFATYFLGQTDRGLAPGQEDSGRRGSGPVSTTGRISKFGVGAIQAGFYIGSSITVVSRARPKLVDSSASQLAAAGSAATLPQPVLEFVMDEAKYKERSGENVFKDDIVKRPNTRLSPELRELAGELGLEAGGPLGLGGGGAYEGSFTYVALRLRPEHEKRLRDCHPGRPGHVGVLARQLAHTYHYYLHPPNFRPDASGNGIAGWLEGVGGSGGGGGGGNDGGGSGGGGDASAVPVGIELASRGHATGMQRGEMSYFDRGGWDEVQLAGLGSLEKQFLSAAGGAFAFDLEVEHTDDEGRLLQHSVHGEVQHPSGGRWAVGGGGEVEAVRGVLFRRS